MKKLPIIISSAIMYVLIGIGLFKFLMEYKQIETIVIPATQTTSTSIPLIPLLIFSIVVFIILIGLGLQILAVFWEWFKSNKTAIMFPVFLFVIAILQLFISLLNTVIAYIETNTAQYLINLSMYVDSCTELIWWIIGGIIAGLIGIGIQLFQTHFVTE